MEQEILNVRLIESFSWVFQVLIPFFVALVPSILVGLCVYLLLRKSRMKEAFEFEKKKRAFEDRVQIIHHFKILLDGLHNAIQMGLNELLFDQSKDDDLGDIIVKRNREVKNFYEKNINIFDQELAQKLSNLSRIVIKGFIVKLNEKRKGNKDFEVPEVTLDYYNFTMAKDDFLDALYKKAELLLS